MKASKLARIAILSAAAIVVSACDTSDDPITNNQPPPDAPPPPPPAMATIEVTVSNLTNAQPLSPIAVIAHTDQYSVFEVGTTASLELELLAESGSNADLIADANANTATVTTASGAAPIPPGASETVSITMLESELAGLQLSTMTMLVNTNDAISGLNAMDISALAAGDVVAMRTVAYDAGTEANTEEASTIPGPAGGGEGFNGARDDHLVAVAMHTGVVSAAGGLGTSDLGEEHRFDNPVVGFRVERVQ